MLLGRNYPSACDKSPLLQAVDVLSRSLQVYASTFFILWIFAVDQSTALDVSLVVGGFYIAWRIISWNEHEGADLIKQIARDEYRRAVVLMRAEETGAIMSPLF